MSDVYLLHFERPLGNDRHKAGHYLGSGKDVEARVREHQKGTSGAYIMEALHYAGIGFYVARTWKDGGRKLERSLKNGKHLSRLCPICTGKVTVPVQGQPAYYPPLDYTPDEHEAYITRKEAERQEREFSLKEF